MVTLWRISQSCCLGFRAGLADEHVWLRQPYARHLRVIYCALRGVARRNMPAGRSTCTENSRESLELQGRLRPPESAIT